MEEPPNLGANGKCCLLCKSPFEATRKDKRFCSRKCQKKSSNNAARGPQDNKTSSVSRKRNEQHYNLSYSLAETYYTTPPQERLGFLKELVDVARFTESPRDKHIKNVLTHKALTYPNRQKKNLFYRGMPFTYCTISELVNRYCKRFLGASSRTVFTSPHFKEPDTGEVV
jgi:hypothetical protein